MRCNVELLKKFTCYIAAARARAPTLSAYLPIHYRPHKVCRVPVIITELLG